MQFFPALMQNNNKDSLFAALSGGPDGGDFQDFAAWLESLQGQEGLQGNNSLQMQALKAEQGPDAAELQKLQDILKQNKQARAELLQLLSSEDAPQGLQKMLQGLERESRLADSELQEISRLLHELGLQGQQKEQALEDLQKGQTESFWSKLIQTLEDLPRDKELNVSREQLTALAKGLGLDGQSRSELDNFLSREYGLDQAQDQALDQKQEKKQALEINRAELSRLLDLMQAEQDKEGLEQKLELSAEDQARLQDLLQELGLGTAEQEDALQAMQSGDFDKFRQVVDQGLQALEVNRAELSRLLDLMQAEQDKGGLEQKLELSAEDQARLQDLLQELGLGTAEQEEALQAMQSRDYDKFRQVVDQGLQEMPREQKLHVRHSEVMALAKGLGLEQGLAESSSGRAAQGQELEMSAREMSRLLELMQDKQSEQSRKGLQQLLARVQAMNEQGQNQSWQELEKIIRQALQHSGQKQGQNQGLQGIKQGSWLAALQEQRLGDKSAGQQKARFGTEALQGDQARSFFAEQGTQQDKNAANYKSGADQDWSQFWKKLQQDGQRQEGSRNEWRGILQAHAQHQESALRQEAQRSDSLQDPRMRQEVLRQVQDGFLRNLAPGRQELSLRLYPPDLGRVDVVLQMQGKELNAVLKTGSQEVGRMLQQQLGSLQQTLEQQGLKVQKLEVQTQMGQDGAAQQWMGEKKHNQAQEDRQRQREWSMRRKWLHAGIEEMQDVSGIRESMTGLESGRGLYLIA